MRRAIVIAAICLVTMLAATVMVSGMMDMVARGMRQSPSQLPSQATAAGSARIERAPRPLPDQSEAIDARIGAVTARVQGALQAFDERVSALARQQEEALKIVEGGGAEARDATEPKPAASGLAHKPDGGWRSWLAVSTASMAQSDQWWNYAALWTCLWVGLTLPAVHALVGLRALGLTSATLAALEDWAINAPPILGVVGTIIAFAGFISTSGGGVISPELFGKAFFDAAATTVVGGLIYVVNLLLFSSIARQLEEG